MYNGYRPKSPYIKKFGVVVVTPSRTLSCVIVLVFDDHCQEQ